MTKVIIDRTKWFRGQGGDHSCLLGEGSSGWYPHEKMCCLGFASLALGASEDEIRGQIYPSVAGLRIDGLTRIKDGDIEDTEFSTEAAKINDDTEIDDAEREAKLYQLASQNGFEFQFIN